VRLNHDSQSDRRLYDQPVSMVAAFILAGGKSSRMGRDKAFLVLGQNTLLSRALALATTVVEQVSIVGDPDKFSNFGVVVPDIYRGHGPLAGIHAALESSQSALNLILGVDMPFLNCELLHYLIRQAGSSEAMVTVPFVEGRYQTLCAVYRKEFRRFAKTALQENRNKIDALFGEISLRVIDEEELSRARFKVNAFRNVNTPQDWKKAEQALKGDAASMMGRSSESI
jgi:molybdenum cofactor guanylyltransferase